MRCIALATELRNQNITPHFICRELDGDLCDFIRNQQFNLHVLPKPSASDKQGIKDSHVAHADWLEVNWQQDSDETIDSIKDITKTTDSNKVDWLILDHYALDHRWEQTLQDHTNNILVIDDLEDRFHLCDILLDQNLYSDMKNSYTGLTPITCNKLIGPEYTLLRDEFIAEKKQLRDRKPQLKKILLFFGGIDSSNETGKALKAIQLLNNSEISIDVIVGGSNPNKEEIKKTCQAMKNTHYHCQIGNIASLIAQTDLAISAGGINTYERCYLGLPSLTITTAFNQTAQNEATDNYGASLLLGDSNNVSSEMITTQLKRLIDSPDKLLKMSHAALSLMSSHTGCSGVIDAMKNTQLLKTLSFRDMHTGDEKTILQWRNAEHVKKYMFTNNIINPDEHARWFGTTLSRNDVDYKIIEIDGQAIGQANIVNFKDNSCHWGFYLGEKKVPRGTGLRFAYEMLDYILKI